MFGHQDDSQPADSQATMTTSQDNNNYDQTMPEDEHGSAGNNDSAATGGQMADPDESQSVNDNDTIQDTEADNAALEHAPDNAPERSDSFTNNYDVDSPKTPSVADDLLDIKQQALGQLSPLINHLDQTPEEKFRTIMMMIQASDNQSLIQEAYAAAQQISDEKAKAQALLDVVNEINYFTHQNNPDNN